MLEGKWFSLLEEAEVDDEEFVAGRRPMMSGKVFPVSMAERACSML